MGLAKHVHLSGLCTYPVCTYTGSGHVQNIGQKFGAWRMCVLIRVVHLSGVHLSGFYCILTVNVVGSGGSGTGTRIGPSSFRLIGTGTTPGPMVHGPVPVQPFSNFNRYFHAYICKFFGGNSNLNTQFRILAPKVEKSLFLVYFSLIFALKSLLGPVPIQNRSTQSVPVTRSDAPIPKLICAPIVSIPVHQPYL